MRWVLNNFASLTIILVVVGGAVALSLAGVVVTRKVFPNLADGQFEEMADGLRTVYELLFSLVLAFVIASVLTTFTTADSAVGSEAASLSHLKRASQQLPVRQQLRLDEALNQYVHALADTEWKTMKEGKASPRASAALQTLYAVYGTYSPPPADGAEGQFYGAAIDQLERINTARRERLGFASAELSSLLKIALVLGAVILLVLESRPRIPLRAQLIHMGLLAAVVSFTCLLTVLLDYPFSGEVSVSNQALKTGSLAEYWANPKPHVLTAGETKKSLSAATLTGVWDSDTFGEMVFRQEADKVIAVVRVGEGTVTGRISPDGVFRGWWCDAPTRQSPDDAGDVEWRLIRTSDGDTAYGSWRYGTDEALRGGWDLTKVGGPEPPDLAARFDDPSAFCDHP